ncbi:hypothetical protein DSUL_20445 [Desulfovibrionales bacterium]
MLLLYVILFSVRIVYICVITNYFLNLVNALIDTTGHPLQLRSRGL